MILQSAFGPGVGVGAPHVTLQQALSDTCYELCSPRLAGRPVKPVGLREEEGKGGSSWDWKEPSQVGDKLRLIPMLLQQGCPGYQLRGDDGE